MTYAETKAGVDTEVAVPIEELSLRRYIGNYCTIFGYSDQTSMLFHLVVKTLADQYNQDSEEYWEAMDLVAKHYSDSVKRMRRNIESNPRHRPKKTVLEDCDYFIEEAMKEIPRTLKEKHHRNLSNALKP